VSPNVAKAWAALVLFAHFSTIAIHAGQPAFVIIAVIVAIHYRRHHP